MKRANGQGTVFQRKDGRWQGQLTMAAIGLQRSTRRTVYGRTQREVLERRGRACSDAAVGRRRAL